MADRLMTVKEVAAWLGVSPRCVWQWAADGIIPPPLALGRLRRWRLAELEEWAAAAPRDIATRDWRQVIRERGEEGQA